MNKFGLFVSTDKREAFRAAELAAVKLREAGLAACASPELIEKLSEEAKSLLEPIEYEDFDKFADAVISFGGDGTMLAAGRLFIEKNLPIMGFNVGKLGFLAEYSTGELEKVVRDLIEGNYRIIDRMALQSEIDGETVYALNDFVVEKKNSSRMISIDAYSNEHLIGTIRGDGLIVSTPTGSTAYSLSCGGPIIAPSTNVVSLTPICPHSLTLRPMILSADNEITLRPYSPTGECVFVADGQIKRTLKNGDSALVVKSSERIKLIKPKNTTYYHLLRKKLLWAANAIDERAPEILAKEQ